ncbi:MAG: T9SS type A sorting domain-containing protein [Brumimicrobium sp.]|nr:T9SS type A sorting domain-containing protein [Brumimicrobium sp.]MCO5269947.1 T9SS type A sorting domain-containing protein [Brumimicrobium sp.]
METKDDIHPMTVIVKSTDGGKNFTQLSIPFDDMVHNKKQVVYHPYTNKFYCIDIFGGIFESSDDCMTWTCISDVTLGASVFGSIAVGKDYLFAASLPPSIDENKNYTQHLYRYEITGGSTPSSIEKEGTLFNVSIYPNPASQFVNIENIPLNSSLKIVDITGSVVYQLSHTNEAVQVSTTKFESGVYFIQIENDGARATRKLIVSK